MGEQRRGNEELELTCADCGAPLGGVGDRSYALAQDRALCWSCALARGGSYDPDQDRWVVEPRVGDLGHPWSPRES